MFNNRKKELTIKILVGQDDGLEKAQKDLQDEDSAPILKEVDKPEEDDKHELAEELMGGAEDEMSQKLEDGEKPKGLNQAVRMNIMKKKLIKE